MSAVITGMAFICARARSGYTSRRQQGVTRDAKKAVTALVNKDTGRVGRTTLNAAVINRLVLNGLKTTANRLLSVFCQVSFAGQTVMPLRNNNA